MNSFIQTIRYNWHPMRIINLIVGVAIVAQAWQVKDWTLSLLGGWFLYQGVFNAGCCGVAGNSFRQDVKNEPTASLQDTDYTEIK